MLQIYARSALLAELQEALRAVERTRVVQGVVEEVKVVEGE